MERKERVGLLTEIGSVLKADIVSYVTGDRPGAAAMIAEDAIRPLYSHILELTRRKDEGGRKRIGLFLYSRGGYGAVPWRIMSMLREYYEEVYVIIPYKAYSAATMLAMGADAIVMGKKAELGPIDPMLVRAPAAGSSAPPDQISVEDVFSYISFMRDRANITDQTALSRVVSLLARDLKPLTLGTVNREYSHIRLLAKKLLASRTDKMDEDRMGAIIEALTEKIYSHGHAISRREAIELRLPVHENPPELESLIWALYEAYEDMLELTTPLDFHLLLREVQAEERILQDVKIACIESAAGLDVFAHNIALRKSRRIPPNPQININVNVPAPPGVDVGKLPQEAQRALQKVMEQLMPAIQGQVQQELVRQSPEIGIERKVYGAMWRRIE